MSILAAYFIVASQTFSLPTGLLSSICWVESHHNAAAVNHHDGGSASQGACQVKLATARRLGFTGTAKQLMEVPNNTYYAAKYLRFQLDRYGDTMQAVAAYNSGSYNSDGKGYPRNQKYVHKVFAAWADGK